MSGGLVPYAWDPSDNQDDGDEEDSLHALESVDKPISLLNPRSVSNIHVLILLVGCLLRLFIALPIVTYVQNSSHSIFIDETGGNTINTPQGALHVGSLVGPGTPHSAKTRVGLMVKPIILFSLVSSITITVHFILVMIPIRKRSTSGICRLAMKSGTINVSSILPMVPFMYESKTFL
jgi:Beta-glucan synthesis-associated protein SKN1/KRE6/Sbg1